MRRIWLFRLEGLNAYMRRNTASSSVSANSCTSMYTSRRGSRVLRVLLVFSNGKPIKAAQYFLELAFSLARLLGKTYYFRKNRMKNLFFSWKAVEILAKTQEKSYYNGILNH